VQPGKSAGAESGFSLIELSVVLVILGILVAVALPMFLGARARAHDLTAKRMTVRAVKAARIIGTNDGTFSGVTTKALRQSEPEISWLGKSGKSTSGSEVSQYVPDAKTTAQTFVAAAYSASGTCFFVQYTMTGATQYGWIPNTTTKKCYAGNAKKAAFGSHW
jgi:type IV pilus assembly protein PilA